MLPQSLPRRTIQLPPADAALGGAQQWIVAFQVALQQQTQWCWAAVSSSVARFFNPATNWSQCAVASAEMGGQCCVTGNSVGCNQPHYLDAALTRVGHLRTAAPGHVPPQAVTNELQLNRPLGIRVGWQMGGGHFLAIVGLASHPTNPILTLSDPIFGLSSIQRSALVNGGYQSGGGRWTHSYAVQP